MVAVALVIVLIAIFLVAYNPLNLGKNSVGTIVTITLTNSEPEPTPANFDQLVQIPFIEYRSYLNPDISNIRFYNSTSIYADQELPAWLMNNQSVNFNSSDVWINLKGTTVPAHGHTDIYMVIYPENLSWGTHWGLAPALSQTYGQHDNGPEVFQNGYWNFANSANSSGWNLINSSAKNGLFLNSFDFGRATHTIQSVSIPHTLSG